MNTESFLLENCALISTISGLIAGVGFIMIVGLIIGSRKR